MVYKQYRNNTWINELLQISYYSDQQTRRSIMSLIVSVSISVAVASSPSSPLPQQQQQQQ